MKNNKAVFNYDTNANARLIREKEGSKRLGHVVNRINGLKNSIYIVFLPKFMLHNQVFKQKAGESVYSLAVADNHIEGLKRII